MKVYDIIINVLFPQELKFYTENCIVENLRYSTRETTKFYEKKQTTFENTKPSKVEILAKSCRHFIPERKRKPHG